MHGRVKVRHTEEQERSRREEQEKQQQEYKLSTDGIFAQRSSGDYDESLLTKIANVLEKTPDIITLWNYRREIILKSVEILPRDSSKELFSKELELTSRCLLSNPKSYASWHYRSWLMTNHPDPDWKAELKTCNMALKLDERNFHCWDYRRFIISNGNISESEEIAYIDTCLENNFSNFSAWHYRTGLLDSRPFINVQSMPISPPPMTPNAFHSRGFDDSSLLEKELDLVHNAVFTDPKDQSPWLYYAWLLGHGERKSYLRDIYISRCLRRIILVFTSPKLISTLNELQLELTVTIPSGSVLSFKPDELGGWNSVMPCQVSALWWLDISHEALSIPRPSIMQQEPLFEPSIHVSLCIKDVDNFDDDGIVLECSMNSHKNESLTHVDLDPLRLFNPSISPVHEPSSLKDELNTVRELVILEPENKWALLSLVALLRYVNPPESDIEVKQALKTLSRIDSQRKRYYEDLSSTYGTEDAIVKNLESHSRHVNLSNSSLTRFYYLDWFALMTHLDFSGNSIDCLPDTMPYLVCLKSLHLDDNRLSSLLGVGGLPSLQLLAVRRNSLVDFDSIEPALHCPQLQTLAIGGNRVADLPNLTDKLAEHPNMRHESHTLSITYDWSED
ncbi:unnamed protein product [Protopolystoma xenopodis]|uniref:Geranylgeranyl transferase type-2 subunit alpha n=1 Tax=Protopolystoma xenopodis TaxID=117903 RepID=A0A3S4ZCE5_9PLAT|nr:unnamed protein product [Protopolystoma xenopodis]